MLIKRSLWTVFSLFFITMAIAQKRHVLGFKIVQMPNPIAAARPGIKLSLNNKIAKATRTEQVFQILNDSLKSFKNMPVKIREQVDSLSFRYYTYLISAPAAASPGLLTIKGSRGSSEKIYKKSQFKQLLTDTLVIIDNLMITVFPKDFNYKIDGYFLRQEKDPSLKIVLASNDSNTLLIREQDFLGIAKSYMRCQLFNEAEDKNEIASFQIRLLSKEEKENVKAVAALLKEEHATGDLNYDNSQVADHLLAYIGQQWGNVKKNNLIDWLKNNF